MKKKALSNLLAALLIAGMLTGCGSQPGSGSGSDGSRCATLGINPSCHPLRFRLCPFDKWAFLQAGYV